MNFYAVCDIKKLLFLDILGLIITSQEVFVIMLHYFKSINKYLNVQFAQSNGQKFDEKSSITIRRQVKSFGPNRLLLAYYTLSVRCNVNQPFLSDKIIIIKLFCITVALNITLPFCCLTLQK